MKVAKRRISMQIGLKPKQTHGHPMRMQLDGRHTNAKAGKGTPKNVR